ncbi:transposase [Nonomuraea sp. NPDC049784]|uniref:transposase n=1 Tax=Nonomuraea sp. NPDC049784 TaxID=3154361 RepID=UPI0033FA696E
MAASRSADSDGWMVIFDELMARIAGRIGRVKPRRTARACVRGLLADVNRKDCWNLAEHAGLIGPQNLQRLLRTVRWDVDVVCDDVRDFVVDRLGPDGVLIANETGFVNRGTLNDLLGAEPAPCRQDLVGAVTVRHDVAPWSDDQRPCWPCCSPSPPVSRLPRRQRNVRRRP